MLRWNVSLVLTFTGTGWALATDWVGSGEVRLTVQQRADFFDRQETAACFFDVFGGAREVGVAA